MPGNERVAASQQYCRVAVMHGLNLQNSRRGEVFQEHAALDFRLDDAAVYVIAQVWMGREHAGYETGPRGVYAGKGPAFRGWNPCRSLL